MCCRAGLLNLVPWCVHTHCSTCTKLCGLSRGLSSTIRAEFRLKTKYWQSYDNSKHKFRPCVFLCWWSPVLLVNGWAGWAVGVISQTSASEFYYITSFSEGLVPGLVPEKRYIIGETQYGCEIDEKLRISRFQQGVVYPSCSNISWFSMWSGIMLAPQASRFHPPEVIWAGYTGNP